MALWANAVYLITPTPESTDAERTALAARVTPVGRRCVVETPRSPVVRVGRNCVVVAEDADDQLVQGLIRLAGVHQVCWATALAHDAALESQLARVRPNDPDLTIDALEQQTNGILGLYHAVQSFRLRYASVEPHLDSTDQIIWRALEEEWQFGRVLDSLDGRLGFLRTLHQQLSSSLQGRRARLLNGLVIAFTFLSIFSILLAAMTFAAMSPLRVGVGTGMALIASLVATLGAYFTYVRLVARS
ncbi:hypothetical protein JCM9533A_02990 [Catenuloplanes niger JCM 9533]